MTFLQKQYIIEKYFCNVIVTKIESLKKCQKSAMIKIITLVKVLYDAVMVITMGTIVATSQFLSPDHSVTFKLEDIEVLF